VGGLKSYRNIPLSPQVVQESMPEYRASKDKISRMTQDGMLLRLKRGLYSVPRSVTGLSLSKELIANHLYGPSYVSFESALSYHGLIPERVYVTKSATLKRKKTYNTPVGHFQYIHVPEEYYPIGLIIEIIENNYAYMMASPEKALCDLILSTSGLRLNSVKSVAEYVIHDLRIDQDSLLSLNLNIIEACALNGYKKEDMRNLFKFLTKLKGK